MMMSAVFELDKARIRSSFSAASSTYDGLAELQRSAGITLLEQWPEFEVGGAVLDLGCGTGFLTGKLLNLSGVQKMIALDISLPMLLKSKGKLCSEIDLNYLCADAESLPLVENSMDWVFSNLALQWCRNLEMVFKEMRRVLNSQGRLAFSTFGPQTLNELKQAWAQVDGYTHVNQFYNEYLIIELMKKAGFQNIRTQKHLTISGYSHVIELMKELKGIGAHNATRGRNRGLTGKTRMQSLFSAYQKFGKEDYLPATFEILYFVAEVGD